MVTKRSEIKCPHFQKCPCKDKSIYIYIYNHWLHNGHDNFIFHICSITPPVFISSFLYLRISLMFMLWHTLLFASAFTFSYIKLLKCLFRCTLSCCTCDLYHMYPILLKLVLTDGLSRLVSCMCFVFYFLFDNTDEVWPLLLSAYCCVAITPG